LGITWGAGAETPAAGFVLLVWFFSFMVIGDE
jgi:hypothetical protein